ncbi:hypothetical protein C7S16_4286 [Burkholderia thailandensis]|uniref:Uncharacterized protein n=1 Tax=Burkholderia thailandensis TaxID=57975 RepID=A0AAW9CSE4_BURTH|nr:hypothetical protein [Burkholderia thailandensis]
MLFNRLAHKNADRFGWPGLLGAGQIGNMTLRRKNMTRSQPVSEYCIHRIR